MRVNISVFTEEEKKKVHERTMKILAEAGVCFKSRKAFEILKEADAKVDEEKQIVYFSEEMVKKALQAAPSSFTLGGRNPAYDFTVPAAESRHLMSGFTTNIYDPYTREKRESLKSDVTNVGRVFQHAETGAACWTGCSACDMPEKTRCLHEMAAIMAGTSKHVQVQLSDPYEAPFAGRILEAVLGSKEAVIRRKIASLVYCPQSPLTQDDKMVDAFLALGDYEIPINVFPLPLIGLTSPASIFSTICQINAEVLSSLVLFQTARPGWPMIYGITAGMIDPVSGAYVKGGEGILVSLGGVEMARFYGLPCAVTGGSSFESMPSYLAGADLIDGVGTTDAETAVSLEMILTEDEIGKRCLRIGKGIRVAEDTDLTDEIISEGPGGNFIAHKSSMKNFRNPDEIYYSKMFPATLRMTTYENRDSIEIANRRVREILEGPVADPIPEDVQAEIDRICAEADAGISS